MTGLFGRERDSLLLILVLVVAVFCSGNFYPRFALVNPPHLADSYSYELHLFIIFLSVSDTLFFCHTLFQHCTFLGGSDAGVNCFLPVLHPIFHTTSNLATSLTAEIHPLSQYTIPLSFDSPHLAPYSVRIPISVRTIFSPLLRSHSPHLPPHSVRISIFLCTTLLTTLLTTPSLVAPQCADPCLLSYFTALHSLNIPPSCCITACTWPPLFVLHRSPLY